MHLSFLFNFFISKCSIYKVLAFSFGSVLVQKASAKCIYIKCEHALINFTRKKKKNRFHISKN